MTVTEPEATTTSTTGAKASTGTRSGAASPGMTAAAFDAIVARLSRQSVSKHFDAYVDVDWENPDFAVDAEDPRWQLWESDGLGNTEWYRSQPVEVQSRVALHRMAAAMRVGWQFENILQRGLLSFVFHLPNGAPEFRYLHHEVIEESQHTLMFQEFVNRTGLPVEGMPRIITLIAEKLVIRMSRTNPTLFFLFVLGGEDPVDHMQRTRLRTGVNHPLLERIMRIHVTEEARHISFARNFLKTEVPKLSRIQRARIAFRAPILYGVMTRLMVDPPSQLARNYGIPRAAMKAARRDPDHKALIAAAASKPRKLCTDLGLVNRWTAPIWNFMGLTETAGADRGAETAA
jgi:hypothetical protein